MAAHDNTQGARRQTARQLNVARGVTAVLAVVIVPHMRQRDNHIGFLRCAQLCYRFQRLFNRIAYLKLCNIFRIGDTQRIRSGQPDNRYFQAHTVKYGPGRKQSPIAAFLIDIGSEKRETRPLLLLFQHAQGLVKFVISQRHSVIANQIHAANVRLCIQ